MAGEEDTELRDLVAQALETKGVLGKIRAELRANVFLVLEEQERKEKSRALTNQKLQTFLKTKDGQLVAGLVREFLEFFELDFTCAVFDPETNVLDTYTGRDKLATEVGANSQTDSPLLLQVLQRTEGVPQARQDGLLATSLTSSSSAPPSVMTAFTSTAFSSGKTREQFPSPPPFTVDGGGGGGSVSGSQSEAQVSMVTKQTRDDSLKSSKSNVDKPTGEGEEEGGERRRGNARNQLLDATRGETQPDSSSDVHRLLSGGTEKRKGSRGREAKKEQASEDSTRLPLFQDGDPSLVHFKEIDGKESVRPTTRGEGGGGEGAGSDDESLLYSAKYETSDQSLSQTSGGGDFDYSEAAQQ